MKYTSYPKYKVADVEWLETQPTHWSGGSLRWFADIFAGGTPSKINEDFWDNGTVPWLNSGSVNQQLITQPSAYITTDALANSSAKWIPADSLVIALAGQGKTKGMAAQLGIDTTCNQSMAAIVPNSKLEPRFLYWWLRSNYQNVRNMAGGDLRDGLNLEMIGSIQCPVPNKYEQTQIAAFLDSETTKIDLLIEKQQRLIELLEEKRQAVISHSVIKGLNPEAPMKDSDVEWLGKVPASWRIMPISRVTRKITNGYVGPTRDILVAKGIPYIQATHIKKGVINFDSKYFVEPAWNEKHGKSILKKNDILVVQTGAGTGDAALVSEDEEGYNCHALIILQPSSETLSGEFLLNILQSNYGVSSLYSIRTGGMHPHLNCSEIRNVPIPIPPLKEQRSISEALSSIRAKFERLSKLTKNQIVLLKERRTALISAAVTGKIDVRDQVPQDVEEVVAS